MRSIIETWLPLPEAVGCLGLILLAILCPLLLLIDYQPKLNSTVFIGSCTANQFQLRQTSIDVPKRDGTPMCLSGLPDEPNQWQWSSDNTVLGFSLQQNYQEEIYIINEDGTGLTHAYQQTVTLMSGWALGPDGTYLKLIGGSPSYGIGTKVYAINGQKMVCSSRSAPGAEIESNCPLIRLKDGRWWDIATGIVDALHTPEARQAGSRGLNP